MALSISQAIATTLFNQADDNTDLILQNNAVTRRLKEKEGRYKTHSGGYELRKPVMYNQTGNGAWFEGLDPLNTTITDDTTAFVFQWKSAAEVVGVSGREKRANKGSKHQLIDLIDMKIDAALARMKNRVSTSVHGDGTGSSGKELVGLQAAVSTSASTGSYGGISRVDYTWARNIARAVSGGITVSNVQQELAALIVQLIRGSDRPDLGVADNTAWVKLHNSMTAIQRIQAEGKNGMSGFQNISFMGIDFVLDGGYGDLAADDEFRILNTDYWSLDVHEDGNFKPIDPKKRAPVNQDAEYQIMLFEGALCNSAPPFNGVLYAS